MTLPALRVGQIWQCVDQAYHAKVTRLEHTKFIVNLYPWNTVENPRSNEWALTGQVKKGERGLEIYQINGASDRDVGSPCLLLYDPPGS